MNLIKLTHPEPSYELWLDPTEIIVMERYKSLILTMQDDRPPVTALVLKSGRTMSCMETPDEIMAIIKVNS
jgi:hypothetical protein